MNDLVLFDRKDAVGRLTLNRPKARNALSLEMMAALQEWLTTIAADEEIRVLVIRGNGPGFSAGHDLKEVADGEGDMHHYRNIFSRCSEMMQQIHRLPQPVIAQVHGIATAAGCQLVAACDLAIAETGATFSTPGIRIGLFCSTPMVPLTRVIGRRRAIEMLLTGRYISAEEAAAYGLVNRVVEPERLTEEAENWAHEIAQHSRFTLAFGKEAFYGQVDMDESSAYDYAKEAIVLNCMAGDAREGIRAFVEKRKPVWQNR